MVQQYWNIIRRWLWLVVLAAVLSGIVAYWFAKDKPATYEAAARLIVGPGIDSLSPDLNDLRAGGQLMQTYAELATTQPVMQSVITQLNLTTSPERLARVVTTKADDTTQILTIRAQAADPQEAASIANAVADTLVAMSPSRSTHPEQLLRSQLDEQVSKIEGEITRIETTIRGLEDQLQNTVDNSDRLIITDRLAQERIQLADVIQKLSTLYESFRKSYTNRVRIIEHAATGDLLDSGFRMTIIMGILAGFVLALSIVLAFEYLKDTIDTSEDLTRASRLPILGVLSKYKPVKGHDDGGLPVIAQPESQVAESYRMLGSKLLLSRYKMQVAELRVRAKQQNQFTQNSTHLQDVQPVRSVLVSGTSAGVDTSEIVANLGVVLAQTGLRVIIVDAYLHRPTLTHWFDLPNQTGLTDILTDQSKNINLLSVDWEPNLSILPSGPIPMNPFELLASPHMAELMRVLKNQADIVMVVASPLLTFADSLMLASHVDGVVLVAQSGKTRRTLVTEIVESLHTLDTNVIGTILNHNSAGQRHTPTQQSKHSTADEQFRLSKGVATPLQSAKF